MCKVCSSLGQKWGNERAVTGSNIILTCPLLSAQSTKSEEYGVLIVDSSSDDVMAFCFAIHTAILFVGFLGIAVKCFSSSASTSLVLGARSTEEIV